MQSKKTYSLFILVCAIFGSTFLAISLGLKAGASPLFFAALRFTIAGSIMLPLLFLFKRISFSRLWPLIGRSAILSLFLTVGSFGCMFIAQTKVDSGFMARLDATGPLFTALFAAMFLGKRLSLPHFAAFFFGTAGSFLIASPAAKAEPFYLAAAAGSVVLYAAGNALYPLLFRHEEDTVTISALQAFLGGLMLMVIALLTETIRFPLAAVGPLLYLTLAGSVIAHTATLILVRDAGPVFASSWLYVAPVIATISGALILDEPVTTAGILGTLLALMGIYLMDRAENHKEKSAYPERKGSHFLSGKSKSRRT